MQLPRMTTKPPIGFSFEVPDLMMLRGWAEFHEIRMAIDLDFSVDGEEYEELIGLYDGDRTFRRWMMWRSDEGVVVQPRMSRQMIFDTVVDALEFLIPAATD